MALATIKVDTSKLRSTAADFNLTGNEIGNLTNNMLGTVRTLTGNVWSGDAASAYVKKFEGLQTDINKLLRMIQEHVDDLNEIAEKYDTSERQNLATANTLASEVIV